MSKGIAGNHTPKMSKDEWLTPPEILQALGEFDLDPCAPAIRPWDTAKEHYCLPDNGLLLPWIGRIWCNPPYGEFTQRWLSKMARHGNGVALIFARTDTEMFHKFVWGAASSILFIKGRLTFYDVQGNKARGNSGGPSCLIAYGFSNTQALLRSKIKGHLEILDHA